MEVNPHINRMLLHGDPDFRKFFQVKADFDDEIRREEKTEVEIARRITDRAIEDLRESTASLASIDGEFDVVSRFFAPAEGIPEDPVTGSAHCTIVPYWTDRLGRTVLLCHQASARGGVLRCRQAGDRVFITGRAVKVMEGHFILAE